MDMTEVAILSEQCQELARNLAEANFQLARERATNKVLNQMLAEAKRTMESKDGKNAED